METKTMKLELKITDVTNENGESYIGYGFGAYRKTDNEEVFCIEDLSPVKEDVENLIKLIADNDVSHLHFEDLIDDFCG